MTFVWIKDWFGMVMSLDAEKIAGVGVSTKAVKKVGYKNAKIMDKDKTNSYFFALRVMVIWFSAEIIFALFKNQYGEKVSKNPVIKNGGIFLCPFFAI